MKTWRGRAASSATQLTRSHADRLGRPDEAAREQIKALRGKAKASFVLAVEDIRHRGCAAAGVRLAGEALPGICRLDLYGAWRLLTVFEAPDRCVLLLVAEHTRSASPYRLLYAALGIDEPEQPRTKPSCCDADGQPPVDPDLAEQFERGLRELGPTLSTRARASARPGWRGTIRTPG